MPGKHRTKPVITKKSDQSIILWSLVMDDGLSSFIPQLGDEDALSIFPLNDSSYLNGQFRHGFSIANTDVISNISITQDINGNGISDNIRSAYPLESAIISPRTLQTRSAQFERSASLGSQERLLALVAVDVPAHGLVPLGFREFVAGEDGTVEYSTPHDGLEWIQPTKYSFIYSDRQFGRNSSVRFSSGESFVEPSSSTISNGTLHAESISGNSPSKFVIASNGEYWVFWVPFEVELSLSSIPGFPVSGEAEIVSVTSFLRRDANPDLQVMDGTISRVEALTRTQQ